VLAAKHCGVVASWTHEGLIRIFGERPDLAAQLLAQRGHPAGASRWSRGEANLSDVDPAELRADLVVTGDAVPPHTIVVEVQLAIDADKRWSWPAYVATLRLRTRGRVTLIVVTFDRRVEAWAARPFEIAPGVKFAPIVFGPSTIPRIDDRPTADANLELATLSALAHRDRRTVRTTCEAVWSSGSALAPLFSDILCSTLELAHAYWEEMMQSGRYEPQTEFARKWVAVGREDGLRRAVTRLVEVRFGEAAGSQAADRIAAADTAQLERWLERIANATSLDAAFDA
jgi:hypothetical protein